MGAQDAGPAAGERERDGSGEFGTDSRHHRPHSADALIKKAVA